MAERQRIIQKILKQTHGESNDSEDKPTTKPDSNTDPTGVFYFDDADEQYSCTSEAHK